MRYLLFVMAIVVCCIPAMAFTPGNGSITYSGFDGVNQPENLVDDELSTQWGNTPGAWFLWDNSDGGVHVETINLGNCRQASIKNATGGIVGSIGTNAGWQNVSISPHTNGNITVEGTGGTYFYCGWFIVNGDDPEINPLIVDFVGSPLFGNAPLYVAFDDTTTIYPPTTSWNWSFNSSVGVLIDNASSETPGVMFTQPGVYSVTHCASNMYLSNCTTKTDYVTVYNATTDYFTTGFAAMDEPRWVQLAGATINLLDVENNSWKNVSSSANGYEEITTLSNHTISAYASMLGYDDAELLSQPACNLCTYRINMYPTGYDNVTEGNVTLYVHVYGSDTTSLPGAYVNLDYPLKTGGRYNTYQTTDINGFAKFVVPNQTIIYIEAEKAGYTRGGTTRSSGNGDGGSASITVEITLQRQYVTTQPTPTVTGTGGTPVTTRATVDPYPCDADHPQNCQRKQTDMANILIEYGPMLVLFFIALTIIGGVKQIGR